VTGANAEEVFKALSQQKINSAVLAGIFSLVLLIGVVFVSRRISRPIVEAADTMAEITKSLDFTRASRWGSDEIAEWMRPSTPFL